MKDPATDGAYGHLRILNNEQISQLLSMADVVDVLREAYEELARQSASYVPLTYLYAPPEGRQDAYYRCSAVIGNSARYRVAATRIKSDLVSWPGGRTEEKYAIEPGTFCGLILLFSSEDARPLAILQDGVIQHMRVGAASALGADILSRPDTETMGLLGSGGMARSHLEAMTHVRSLNTIKVFSPNRVHADKFCADMSEMLAIDVESVGSAEEAVAGSDLIVSATDSLVPTFDPVWVSPGAHVTCISKRELDPLMYEVATQTVTLGLRSLPADASIPGLQHVKGGLSAFIAGTPEQQARIPRGGGGRTDSYPALTELMVADSFKRKESDITLFLTGGTQGVQFSAVGGHVLAKAEQSDIGIKLPTSWFVEHVRN